jgi:hypothetical protein
MTGSSSHGGGVTFGANQTKEFSQFDGTNASSHSMSSASHTPGRINPKTPEEKSKLERGWTMHSRRVTSHNVQIQRNIDTSRLQLYQSWLSPRSKQMEVREAESNARRIAARLGLGIANVDKSSLRHLLKEASYVDASDNATVRSQGSAKKGQAYAHIMGKEAQERMLKDKSMESHLAKGSNDPQYVFDAFKIKLYARSQVWYEKRGLSRDMPTQPITEPPVAPVIPLLVQLLQTPRPFSAFNAKPHDPDAGTDTDTDGAPPGHGISVEQVGLWKRIRKEALERFEWEEYRQALASQFVPVARKNTMGGLFGSNPDDEGESRFREGDENKKSVGQEEEETDYLEEGEAESKANVGDAPNRRSSMKIKLDASGEEGCGSGTTTSDSAANLASAYDAQGNSLRLPSAAAVAGETVPAIISSSDADAAIRYLQTARPYILADRTNTEYVWQLNITNAITSKTATVPSQMILLWARISSPNAPLGSINLSDLKTLTYDAVPEPTRQASAKAGISVIGANTGMIITLQLGNSPKALRNSGGRTKLILKGSQVQETKKMHLCLRNLWLVATKQSKLVSVESMLEVI